MADPYMEGREGFSNFCTKLNFTDKSDHTELINFGCKISASMSTCKTESRQLCVSCGLLRWNESYSQQLFVSVFRYDHMKLAGIPL